MVPVPATGRVFRQERRVGLGDTDPDGRLRLDAIASYLQDVSNEDTIDAGFGDVLGWVVRRTVLEVQAPGVFGELLELATFCGGFGCRWAERRVSIRGDQGASVEATTLWVHVEMSTLRPMRLPARFHDLFAEAAGGRVVGSRLELGLPPGPGAGDGAGRRVWPLRHSDYDMLGHLNNAAYWEVLGEELARHGTVGAPLRAVMEFRAEVAAAPAVDVVVRDGDRRLDLWIYTASGVLSAAGAVAALTR